MEAEGRKIRDGKRNDDCLTLNTLRPGKAAPGRPLCRSSMAGLGSGLGSVAMPPDFYDVFCDRAWIV